MVDCLTQAPVPGPSSESTGEYYGKHDPADRDQEQGAEEIWKDADVVDVGVPAGRKLPGLPSCRATTHSDLVLRAVNADTA
ncbi:diphthine methyl ester synthase [Lates japonicus]|uniref:Diphthine methyl ester synthase n=1 Tax=Lates japonicus TaxID=270547 RepID=A0AAD3RIR5_LATJO|nr:diphthine methyl ester synthase [Lates japonicus]